MSENVAQTASALVNGNSVNLGLLIGLIVLILIVLIVLAKNGMLSFKGKMISFGRTDEQQREVTRKQIEFTASETNELYEFLPKAIKEANEFKARYIVELIYDEIVNWITVNHITTDEFYINSKQTIVWNKLKSFDILDTFSSEEKTTYKERCFDIVKHIIERLYKIKEYYYEKK